MDITYTHHTIHTENNQGKINKPLRKRSSDLINYRQTRKRRKKGVWQHELAFYPIAEVTDDPVTFFSKLTRLEKRILNLIIKHSIAYVNVFPSQAWLAEKADCSLLSVNRILAFLTDLQVIDKLNYNTRERVEREEYMTCSYSLSGWFNNLSIRDLLRPLFPALVIVPLMLLFTPDLAAQEYAQFKGLDGNDTGTLRKEYIYRVSQERTEAPSRFADRLSLYHEYNLFGELRGPIVGLYEAINHFKKECLMDVTVPKRPLTLIEQRVNEESPQQTDTGEMAYEPETYGFESSEEFMSDDNLEHGELSIEDDEIVWRPHPTPISSKPCGYPVSGGILARKEFYKKNPHHSEFQCEDCKKRRRQ